MKIIELTGQRFGRLVVSYRTENSKCGEVKWVCQCDCGKQHIVSSGNLKNGHVSSCGCLKQMGDNNRKHSLSKSRAYSIWTNMKTRCYNPNSKDYANYHGHGITVCDEWKNDFQAFYDYVSQLPHFGEDGYTLDRINNDGNYEPGNVRWATATEQANNTRRVLSKDVVL